MRTRVERTETRRGERKRAQQEGRRRAVLVGGQRQTAATVKTRVQKIGAGDARVESTGIGVQRRKNDPRHLRRRNAPRHDPVQVHPDAAREYDRVLAQPPSESMATSAVRHDVNIGHGTGGNASTRGREKERPTGSIGLLCRPKIFDTPSIAPLGRSSFECWETKRTVSLIRSCISHSTFTPFHQARRVRHVPWHAPHAGVLRLGRHMRQLSQR